MTESVVKELAPHTRPRQGWRAYGAKRLGYLDARDDNQDEMRVGQDECDPSRVVIKTFYSWQTVDAVRAAREKRRKAARRGANGSGSSGYSGAGGGGEAMGGLGGGRTRWWSAAGRRSGAASPVALDGADTRDGCTIM